MINAAGSLTTHTWDIGDRMTKVEVAGGAVNSMSHDGDGKRRRTEDSGGLHFEGGRDSLLPYGPMIGGTVRQLWRLTPLACLLTGLGCARDMFKTRSESPSLGVISGETGVVFPRGATLRRSLKVSTAMGATIYAEVMVASGAVREFASRPVPGIPLELKDGYELRYSVGSEPPWWPSAGAGPPKKVRGLGGSITTVKLNHVIELLVLPDAAKPEQALVYLYWDTG